MSISDSSYPDGTYRMNGGPYDGFYLKFESSGTLIFSITNNVGMTYTGYYDKDSNWIPQISCNNVS